MSCPDWEDRIEDWLDGRATDEEHVAIERHLASSADCRAYVEERRRLRQAVAALPRELPPARDLWPEIAARLETRVPSGERDGAPMAASAQGDDRVVRPFRRRADPRTWHGGWLAAAALLLVAFGATLSRWWMPAPGGDQLAGTTPAPIAVPTRVTPAGLNLDGDALAAYASARSALVTAIDARRGDLQPETVAAVERNLLVIDGAIREIESALREDPENPQLERMLLASYRQEIDLLQRLAGTEA